MIRFILLQTFTTGFVLGWILRFSWFVNVSMIVLAIVIKCDTSVNWRVVMLIAFIRILRNPKGKHNENLRKKDPLPQVPFLKKIPYHEVEVDIEIMKRT